MKKLFKKLAEIFNGEESQEPETLRWDELKSMSYDELLARLEGLEYLFNQERYEFLMAKGSFSKKEEREWNCLNNLLSKIWDVEVALNAVKN